MSFLTTIKALFGSAWHVNSDAIHTAMWPATDGTVEASKPVVVDSNKDVTGVRNLTVTGTLAGAGLSPTGDLTMAEGKNFIFGATTGTNIGTTATQKLAFYGAVPVVQPSVLAAITTTQPTATVFGFTTTAQFDALIAAVNTLIANQKSLGLQATA